MTNYSSWSASQLKAAATEVNASPLRQLAQILITAKANAETFQTDTRASAASMVGGWSGEAAASAYGTVTGISSSVTSTESLAASAESTLTTYTNGLSQDRATASGLPATPPPKLSDYGPWALLSPIGAAAKYAWDSNQAENDRKALVTQVVKMDQAGSELASTIDTAFPQVRIESGVPEPRASLTDPPSTPPPPPPVTVSGPSGGPRTATSGNAGNLPGSDGTGTRPNSGPSGPSGPDPNTGGPGPNTGGPGPNTGGPDVPRTTPGPNPTGPDTGGPDTSGPQPTPTVDPSSGPSTGVGPDPSQQGAGGPNTTPTAGPKVDGGVLGAAAVGGVAALGARSLGAGGLGAVQGFAGSSAAGLPGGAAGSPGGASSGMTGARPMVPQAGGVGGAGGPGSTGGAGAASSGTQGMAGRPGSSMAGQAGQSGQAARGQAGARSAPSGARMVQRTVGMPSSAGEGSTTGARGGSASAGGRGTTSASGARANVIGERGAGQLGSRTAGSPSGSGQASGRAGMAGGRGGKGKRDERNLKGRPAYLVESDEIWGDGRTISGGVIGAPGGADVEVNDDAADV